MLALLVIAGNSFGQCEIDYDFGDAGFGVSPDNALGETFMNGEVGLDYYDVLHILVPEFAQMLMRYILQHFQSILFIWTLLFKTLH